MIYIETFIYKNGSYREINDYHQWTKPPQQDVTSQTTQNLCDFIFWLLIELSEHRYLAYNVLQRQSQHNLKHFAMLKTIVNVKE